MAEYSFKGTLTLVDDEGGDWTGLYINGRLVHEGHSISGKQMLEILGIPFDNFEVPYEDMERMGRLPSDLPKDWRK